MPSSPGVILAAGVFGMVGYGCWVRITQHSVGLQEDCFQKAAPRDNLTSKEVKTKSWCWGCLHFPHVPACVWVWACSSCLEWPWAVTTFLCTSQCLWELCSLNIFFFLIGKRKQITLWHTACCGLFREQGGTAGVEQHCRWLALDLWCFLATDGEPVLMFELFREVIDKLTSVSSLLMTGCLLVSNFVLY